LILHHKVLEDEYLGRLTQWLLSLAVYAFSFVGATPLLPLLSTNVNCIQIAMLHQPIDSAERAACVKPGRAR